MLFLWKFISRIPHGLHWRNTNEKRLPMPICISAIHTIHTCVLCECISALRLPKKNLSILSLHEIIQHLQNNTEEKRNYFTTFSRTSGRTVLCAGRRSSHSLHCRRNILCSATTCGNQQPESGCIILACVCPSRGSVRRIITKTTTYTALWFYYIWNGRRNRRWFYNLLSFRPRSIFGWLSFGHGETAITLMIIVDNAFSNKTSPFTIHANVYYMYCIL